MDRRPRFALALIMMGAAVGHAPWVLGFGLPAAPGAVQRVQTQAPVVALTFDACPTKRSPQGFDRAIFEFLRTEHIPATVFVSGQWVEHHPAEARALADEPLIELGNHSYAHPPLSRISGERLRNELDATDRMIEALGRHSVGVRPPFGDWSPPVLAALGNTPLVLWDVVSGDAGGHVPAERMIEDVSRRTKAGSIVIFHINGRGPYTKNALPEIVRRLRARGLRFVHVSELLRLPDAAVVQAQPGRDSALKRAYRPAYECD
jgi:peptidoglycan/xylan/chitin deacetylase (PgdA/CDA1 family)